MSRTPMPKMRRSAGRLVGVIALSAVISGCGAKAHARPEDMPPTLTLSAPGGAAEPTCTPVSGLGFDRHDVALVQSFTEPFDRLDLAKGRWTPHYDGGYDWLVKRTMASDHEQQIYVDPGYAGKGHEPLGLDPFDVHDGVLSIIGRPTPPDKLDALYGYAYTSGVLTSRQSFVQTYGYFEIRARMPTGKATWPAFWLLPTDRSWPPEIDVLEVLGSRPGIVETTAHWKDASGHNQASGCHLPLADLTTQFHNYGVLWEPDRLTWYLDRRPVGSMATPPGIDKPIYLILNLALGGDLVGRVDEQTPLPARFEIDHVAAYQLAKPASAGAPQ